jgi:tetratricopeptide (TPR) repeat protein
MKKLAGNSKETKSNSSISITSLLVLILISLLTTFFAFQSIRKNQFTNWDDDRYIVNNPDITKSDFKSLKVLVTKPYEGNHHPLTMLSYAWNYSNGKLNPKVYFTTNLYLHLFNTLLVFLFVWMLFKKEWLSVITSLLFGIHPLHVESVAWASERKDLVYCFFFLLSIITYIQYIKNSKYGWYFASILLFILALLGKAMAVPLVGVLILIDLIQKEKLSLRLILEKIPFVIIAVITGIYAIKAQQLNGATTSALPFSTNERISIACFSFLKYILLLLYPYKLSAFYPYPKTVTIFYWVSLFVVASILLGIGFWILSNKWKTKNSKAYLFGFLFFVFNILLVLQIIQVGNATMADRYTYVSGIGIFIIIGYMIESSIQKYSSIKIPLLSLFFVYVIFLTYTTINRCKVWHDSFSLWNDVIQKYPEVDIAYTNRGLAKEKKGDISAAFEDYKKSAETNPSYALAWNNMGSMKAMLNQQTEAIQYFNKAIATDPKFLNAYMNRAKSKAVLMDHEGALKDYDFYIKNFQGNPDVYNDRGLERQSLKDYQGSIEDFNKAIEIGPKVQSPNIYMYYLNRGLSQAYLNNFQSAFEDYEKALALNPTYADGYNNRGVLKCYTKDFKGGCEDFEYAITLGSVHAKENLQRYCGNSQF